MSFDDKALRYHSNYVNAPQQTITQKNVSVSLIHNGITLGISRSFYDIINIVCFVYINKIIYYYGSQRFNIHMKLFYYVLHGFMCMEYHISQFLNLFINTVYISSF